MMNGMQYEFKTLQKEIEKKLTFQGKALLSYRIVYPQFSANAFGNFLRRLNTYYELKAKKFRLHCEKKLFRLAVDQYEYAQRNKLPLPAFEAQQVFTVTYQKNCALSLYTDTYEYLGGAHGNTTRASDTWNLTQGARGELYQYFPAVRGLKQFLTSEVIQRIEGDIETETGMWFEEYEENTVTHFDSSSFYLNDQGVVLYYQQYDLAPYAAGIPTFLFAYRTGGAVQPTCMRRVR